MKQIQSQSREVINIMKKMTEVKRIDVFEESMSAFQKKLRKWLAITIAATLFIFYGLAGLHYFLPTILPARTAAFVLTMLWFLILLLAILFLVLFFASLLLIVKKSHLRIFRCMEVRSEENAPYAGQLMEYQSKVLMHALMLFKNECSALEKKAILFLARLKKSAYSQLLLHFFCHRPRS